MVFRGVSVSGILGKEGGCPTTAEGLVWAGLDWFVLVWPGLGHFPVLHSCVTLFSAKAALAHRRACECALCGQCSFTCILDWDVMLVLEGRDWAKDWAILSHNGQY